MKNIDIAIYYKSARNVRLFIVLLCITVMVFSACNREEIDIVTIDESIDPPKLYHDNSYIGRVSTNNGTPINGAVVHIGNIQNLTDGGGFYKIINRKVNKKGNLIKVSAQNHYDAYQFNRQITDEIGFNHFKLLPKLDFIIVDNTKSQIITLADGVELEVEANSVISDDEIGTGKTLKLYTKYLKGGEEQINNLYPLAMPFESRILDFNNSVFLIIELFDDRGAPAKFKKPVQLYINNLEIKNHEVLKINETSDSWTRSGEITEVNNKLKIDLNSNGYYAIAKADEACLATIEIHTTSGLNVFNATIQINQKNTTSGFNIISNQSGKWTGFLKKNEAYDILIKNPCGEVITSKSIHTNSNDVFNEKIIIEDIQTRTINYQLRSCNNNSISVSDQVTLVMKSDEEQINMLLKDSGGVIAFMSCDDIKKLAVYQSDQLKWIEEMPTLSAGEISKQSILIKNEDVCLHEIGGWVNIAGKLKLYKKDDLIILFAPAGSNALEISDINNFTFSIGLKGVEGPGKYTPETIIFNAPTVVFCEKGACSNIEVNIKKISTKDNPVVVEITGNIGDVPISGAFEKELFNN